MIVVTLVICKNQNRINGQAEFVIFCGLLEKADGFIGLLELS